MKSKANSNSFYFIILLIINIGYFQFFAFNAIPREIRIISGFGSILIIAVFLIVKYIYGNTDEIKKRFALPSILFIVAMLLSTIVSKAEHHQSFALSIWISRGIFFYLLYFFLHAYKFDRQTIEKVVLSIGLITIVFFYIQTIIYPTQIFDVRMTIDRGTLRLFLPSMGYTILAYFYFLNRYFKDNKLLDVIIVILALSIFILQATRQLIASLVLLTILNLFRSKEVKSRSLIIFLLTIGMGALVIVFYDLFVEIFAVSKSQAGDTKESIRSMAISFFLNDFQPSTSAYILGNGEGHQASPYGMKLRFLQLSKGFYLSDIGIVGDYVKYGILFVIAALIMLIKFLTIKVPREYEYLRYFVYLSLFTLFTSRGIFGAPNII
ncbi:MAG: hypothetical protein IH594_10060, partial [Bacteroidales bacterium]|nr:hypothetical protein [Bacteroidales bacterium]